MSDAAQLFVNQRRQLSDGRAISLPPVLEQSVNSVVASAVMFPEALILSSKY
jgi:hypothetical protein